LPYFECFDPIICLSGKRRANQPSLV
jgi:hypothetical protein